MRCVKHFENITLCLVIGIGFVIKLYVIAVRLIQSWLLYNYFTVFVSHTIQYHSHASLQPFLNVLMINFVYGNYLFRCGINFVKNSQKVKGTGWPKLEYIWNKFPRKIVSSLSHTVLQYQLIISCRSIRSVVTFEPIKNLIKLLHFNW